MWLILAHPVCVRIRTRRVIVPSRLDLSLSPKAALLLSVNVTNVTRRKFFVCVARGPRGEIEERGERGESSRLLIDVAPRRRKSAGQNWANPPAKLCSSSCKRSAVELLLVLRYRKVYHKPFGTQGNPKEAHMYVIRAAARQRDVRSVPNCGRIPDIFFSPGLFPLSEVAWPTWSLFDRSFGFCQHLLRPPRPRSCCCCCCVVPTPHSRAHGPGGSLKHPLESCNNPAMTFLRMYTVLYC